MPEGDAVWRAARRLNNALAEEPLVGVDLRWSRMPDVALHGRMTLEVVPVGKHILHRVEGGWTIHSHLRMDGSWRVQPTASVTPRVAQNTDIRAIVASADNAAVGRKLGMLDLVPTDQEDSLVGHLGPDLLSAAWDEDEAVRRLREHPDLTIGESLLDQRNLAGLGTMWVAESVHEQWLDPWQSVASIPDDRLRATLRSGHRLLHQAITPTGPQLQVFDRVGRTCYRCGALIASAQIGPSLRQRPMAYCTGCQQAK